MKEEYEGLSAEQMYYASKGCGCCTYGNEPEWDDILKQLRKEIAEESK